MKVGLETLIAFADGELAEAERAEVQRALDADPALRAQLEAQQRLRARIGAAFAPIAQEPPPAKLVAAVQAPSNVVSLAARRPRWSAREWAAMAASLAAGLTIGIGVLRPQPVVSTLNATLVASGQLHQALDTQLASDTERPVRIGLTYRNRDGAVCRTFAMNAAHMQGLACRAESQWRLEIVTHDASVQSGDMRTAGTEIDPAILQAAQANMSGDAFDATAERQARDAHWRAPGSR
ncbi:MAG: anti-sigma factor [Proteobacteria bacterium]|nr:anti-sigma factor [Pseudomonadota bacterium]